jgi:hypothetical protein
MDKNKKLEIELEIIQEKYENDNNLLSDQLIS